MINKISKRKILDMMLLPFLTFIWNYVIYTGARLIAHSWHHVDMTTSIDSQIPFMPWTIAVYASWYILWGVNYCIVAAHESDDRARFFCADAVAKVICFAFFLIIPTTNVRPEIDVDTFWGSMVGVLHFLDAPDNLFPSIHCLVSWLCWIGVRSRKDIHPAYRYFTLFAAIAVCISTLTTRQHVIVDVFAGIALAEFCYFICGFKKIYSVYARFVSRIMRLFKVER